MFLGGRAGGGEVLLDGRAGGGRGRATGLVARSAQVRTHDRFLCSNNTNLMFTLINEPARCTLKWRGAPSSGAVDPQVAGCTLKWRGAP